ncbi:MAG: P-loop NTPase fold protein [Holosporaceae bacterium]
MSVNAIPHPLNPDCPLTEAANDALGIARSAQTIAQSILTMDANNGFAIGIYGEWGLGKTTYMNFVKEELQKAEKGQKPIIVDFNPWLFSNHTDLIQQFFVELSKEFPRNKFWEWGEAKKALLTADTILTYAVTAAATAKLGPVVGGAVHTATKKTIPYFRNKPSLSKKKIQITEKLKKLDQKIIVFIDDIDRLDPDDMLSIFKLVKSVADFPNIIYILGLDLSNTCALLEGKHVGLNGSGYLDKIVQYPIDLPHPGENRLNKLLGNFINATLDQEDDKNFDQYKRYRFYNQYLSKKLNTPRAVMRLSSAFNLHYNRLRGDVDPVDFLAIESIRLLDPAFFPEIQRHSKLFLRTDFDDINNKETPSKIYIDEKLKNNIILRNGLQIIFPNWNKKDSSRLPDSSQKSLICSPNYFARYFSHVIDDHEFTKQQINDDLAETDDVKKFEEKLDSYKNQIIDENETKLNYFFSKLNDIIDDVDIKIYYKNLCHCFLIIGDNYLDVHKLISSLGGYFTAQTSIICIIEKILKEDRGSVYIILNDSFKESDSIYTCSQTFRFFLAEYGLYNEPKKAFDDQSPQPYLTES